MGKVFRFLLLAFLTKKKRRHSTVLLLYVLCWYIVGEMNKSAQIFKNICFIAPFRFFNGLINSIKHGHPLFFHTTIQQL